MDYEKKLLSSYEKFIQLAERKYKHIPKRMYRSDEIIYDIGYQVYTIYL